MSSPEKQSNPEYKTNPEALREAAREHGERLREERAEKAGEATRENLDEARHEALERATSIEREKTHAEQQERQPSPAERRNRPIGKAERDASFNATMSEIQTHMSAPSRAFSKVIHNKAVEKASEVGAATIARPNAILSGAVAAFVLTLAVYLIAKNLGYPLSGFETIGAFALGWILGIAYDFLKIMVTGRK